VPEPLEDAVARLRPLLLDADRLVRAVASGRRRGSADPVPGRAELRPVDLKAGRRLQVVATDDRGPVTRQHVPGAASAAVVDALLAEPFGTWHVETVDRTVQLRVTKKGQAQVHTARASRRGVEAAHDRPKRRLLDPGDPLFDALGAEGDKRRQVDAFLRLLAPVATDVLADADRAGRPLRVVDLGCGNAYLTFAAHRYLSMRAGDHGVRTVGVDVRPDLIERRSALAGELEMGGLSFVAGTIAEADPGVDGVDVVLALHACDTATDQALARAVGWRTPVVLAAPCCHHDIQRQLAHGVSAAPHPYGAVVRHPILRERFADVLTDALRAALLRLHGYRVDVVEFVDSRHTPRNALLRARRTAAPATGDQSDQYRDLVAQWGVTPALATLLGSGG
jgi:SAM-dependent methyltransferase